MKLKVISVVCLSLALSSNSVFSNIREVKSYTLNSEKAKTKIPNIISIKFIINKSDNINYREKGKDEEQPHYNENRRTKHRRSNISRISIPNNFLLENNDRRVVDTYISIFS